jgi:hypothetical protein
MRITISADDRNGLDSVVSPHFGRCPHYTLVGGTSDVHTAHYLLHVIDGGCLRIGRQDPGPGQALCGPWEVSGGEGPVKRLMGRHRLTTGRVATDRQMPLLALQDRHRPPGGPDTGAKGDPGAGKPGEPNMETAGRDRARSRDAPACWR